MKQKINISLFLAIVSAIPMTMITAIQISYIVPFIASTTAILLYDIEFFNSRFKIDLQNKKTYVNIFVTVMSIITLGCFYRYGVLDDDGKALVMLTTYILFTTYIWYIQHVVDMCNAFTQKIIFD